MKIGIDISSLQGAHRMRGIGYTTTNFLKNIPSNGDEFVLFIDENAEVTGSDVVEALSLDFPYETRSFTSKNSKKALPWKLKYISKLQQKLGSITVFRTGYKGYGDLSDLDAFIQFDQGKPLPASQKGMKRFFIAYDLIPYVLKDDYLIDYHTARQRGLSKRASLRSAIDRYAYLKKLNFNCEKADGIFAISETTRHDYLRFCKVNEQKIHVTPLGVSDLTQVNSASNGTVNRYRKTSWGYIAKPDTLKNLKFLLFVGGADERRRLHDLITAFNHLKAQGSDIKLVLSGDIMKGPLDIPTPAIQKSLLSSSYINDIYFLGFTDDTTRNWLYKNALAFVFPSVYEGFGLPILEAMSLETLVICYKNDAIREVAGSIPFYAHDSLSLVDSIKKIENMNPKELLVRTKDGLAHAQKYTWQHTSKNILKQLHESFK